MGHKEILWPELLMVNQVLSGPPGPKMQQANHEIEVGSGLSRCQGQKFAE